jgi:DNA-binding transcriptional LysR family regulator
MRAVADTHHLTPSAVSQQMAALERETGAKLIEPEGRRNCVRHRGHEGRRAIGPGVTTGLTSICH